MVEHRVRAVAGVVRPRGAITFLVVWALLQLPRLIAVPLIRDVLDGSESDAWMYAAVLDVVVAAVSAPGWSLGAVGSSAACGDLDRARRGVSFCVSIVDHGDADHGVAAVAGAPAVLGGRRHEPAGRPGRRRSRPRST